MRFGNNNKTKELATRIGIVINSSLGSQHELKEYKYVNYQWMQWMEGNGMNNKSMYAHKLSPIYVVSTCHLN